MIVLIKYHKIFLQYLKFLIKYHKIFYYKTF